MSEIIDIRSYLEICDNCKWYNEDRSGTCLRPGGWRWKSNYHGCADFERKTGKAVLSDERKSHI